MSAYGVKLQRSRPLSLQPSSARGVEDWVGWATRQRRPLAVDLFAGGGGLSLGLEQAGYRVALAVDHEARAVETHAHNFQGLALRRDLSDAREVDELIRLLRQVPVALIAGGPPCQPFSRAGRSKIRSLVRDGLRPAEDDRRSLWQTFLRVALEVRPEAVLLENVPDMALGDELVVVRHIVAELEDAGYDTYVRLVEAWRHGVPQHRQRLILAAVREDASFAWPREQPQVMLWDAIGDLPRLGEGTGGPELDYDWRQPLSAFQRRARRGMRDVDRRELVWDHQTRPVREDDRRAFGLMSSTTRYSDLPAELRRYGHESFDDKYKRLARNEPSRSITAHIAKDGYWYIHPDEPRTLTVREAARLQTFPDHYRFAGSRSDAFRQIGNAVPPALAAAVGRSLLKAGQSGGGAPRLGRTVAAGLHEALANWARDDRLRRPWAYPATQPSEEHSWQVLVATVLASSKGDDSAIRRVLTSLPRPPDGQGEQIAAAGERESAGVRRALTRLRAAPSLTGSTGPEGTRWEPQIRLGPAERERYAALAHGEDRILVGAGVARVAARVSGTDVDRVRRRSDGRVAVARLVGSGADAPLRMAALGAIGSSICTEDVAACGACPLLAFCPGPVGS